MANDIRVLYVDDEPYLLDIGKLFLERSGEFLVTTCISAPAALELLKTEKYDAIISDYLMPEMDGIAFLKQLKTSGNTTPFIIFTGRGREEVVIEALNSGADFYLQKGGEPKSQFTELAHKIRAAVSRKETEKLANDTERRLFDIINFLPDATFAIDIEGHVIVWNKAIEEMTGVPARDILGKGDKEYSIPFYGERRPVLIDLVSISDEELTRNWYTIIKKEGDILIAETRLPRPLGKYSILLGKASLLYNNEGEVIGAIESIRDITEQKQVQEKLRLKLDSVLFPDVELEIQDLANIIDTASIQSLMEDLYAATGMPIGIIDLEGNILVKVGWQDICTNFHRVNSETLKNCIESNISLSSGVPEGSFHAYRCKNGMWDIATPIFIGSKQIGNLFFGQFFYEDEVPDLSVFIAHAEKYGFNKDEYLRTLHRCQQMLFFFNIVHFTLFDMKVKISFNRPI